MGKSDGESYDFVPPDFNEDEFIHKEMVEFRTTVIRTVVAIVAALVAWGLFIAFDGDDRKAWPAGLAVALAFGLALKPIFARFTDISVYKRMDWVGTGLMFFLTWLAFFVIAVNPPVSDVSPPQVEVSADPPVQAPGQTVVVSFLATDNAHLSGPPALRLERDGVPIDLPEPAFAPHTADGRHYTATISNPTTVPGRYSVLVSATDARGHTNTAQTNFTVQAAALRVTAPRDGNLSGVEAIIAQVDAPPCTHQPPPCLRTVYFAPEGGGTPVPFEYNEARAGWEATARFAGWKAGENTGAVVAQFLDHYQRTFRVDGRELRSEPVTVNVTPAGGDPHVVAVVGDPTAPPAAFVPGYGFLGTLVAVVGVAAILRRR